MTTPLPPPEIIITDDPVLGPRTEVYTAEQMTAYGQACHQAGHAAGRAEAVDLLEDVRRQIFKRAFDDDVIERIDAFLKRQA